MVLTVREKKVDLQFVRHSIKYTASREGTTKSKTQSNRGSHISKAEMREYIVEI